MSGLPDEVGGGTIPVMSSPSDPSARPGGLDEAQTPWSGSEIAVMIGSVVLITLSAFESLATTTIMPNVVADLGAQSWFSVASGAALAAQLLSTVMAGALSDSRGPRPVLLSGMALFVIGLGMCASAPHIAIFVAGRLVQGLGGGLVIVTLYVLVGAVATDRHRATFFAGFSLAWVLPSLVGPAIAGFVASHAGWRVVFGAVPIIAVVAVIPLLPQLRRFHVEGSGRDPGTAHLAALGLTAGLGVVILQLAGTSTGWGLVAMAVLGITLTSWSLPRLVPAGTLRLALGMPSAIATRFLAMGALTGATAFMPLVLQRVHGWSIDHAAIAVTIGSVSWAVGATLQARVRDPRLRMRLPLIGAVALTLGLLPVTLLVWASAPVWPALVGWFVSGFGIGFLHSTLSDLVLGMSDRSEHGKVSSWLQVADNAGSALELALVSIALALWSGAQGAVYLPASLVALVAATLAIVSAARIIPGRQGAPS